MCLQVCPHHVFRTEGRKVQIQNRDGCMECGACARNCPTGAISVRSGVGWLPLSSMGCAVVPHRHVAVLRMKRIRRAVVKNILYCL